MQPSSSDAGHRHSLGFQVFLQVQAIRDQRLLQLEDHFTWLEEILVEAKRAFATSEVKLLPKTPSAKRAASRIKSKSKDSDCSPPAPRSRKPSRQASSSSASRSARTSKRKLQNEEILDADDEEEPTTPKKTTRPTRQTGPKSTTGRPVRSTRANQSSRSMRSQRGEEVDNSAERTKSPVQNLAASCFNQQVLSDDDDDHTPVPRKPDSASVQVQRNNLDKADKATPTNSSRKLPGLSSQLLAESSTPENTQDSPVTPSTVVSKQISSPPITKGSQPIRGFPLLTVKAKAAAYDNSLKTNNRVPVKSREINVPDTPESPIVNASAIGSCSIHTPDTIKPRAFSNAVTPLSTTKTSDAIIVLSEKKGAQSPSRILRTLTSASSSGTSSDRPATPQKQTTVKRTSQASLRVSLSKANKIRKSATLRQRYSNTATVNTNSSRQKQPSSRASQPSRPSSSSSSEPIAAEKEQSSRPTTGTRTKLRLRKQEQAKTSDTDRKVCQTEKGVSEAKPKAVKKSGSGLKVDSESTASPAQRNGTRNKSNTIPVERSSTYSKSATSALEGNRTRSKSATSPAQRNSTHSKSESSDSGSSNRRSTSRTSTTRSTSRLSNNNHVECHQHDASYTVPLDETWTEIITIEDVSLDKDGVPNISMDFFSNSKNNKYSASNTTPSSTMRTTASSTRSLSANRKSKSLHSNRGSSSSDDQVMVSPEVSTYKAIRPAAVLTINNLASDAKHTTVKCHTASSSSIKTDSTSDNNTISSATRVTRSKMRPANSVKSTSSTGSRENHSADDSDEVFAKPEPRPVRTTRTKTRKRQKSDSESDYSDVENKRPCFENKPSSGSYKSKTTPPLYGTHVRSQATSNSSIRSTPASDYTSIYSMDHSDDSVTPPESPVQQLTSSMFSAFLSKNRNTPGSNLNQQLKSFLLKHSPVQKLTVKERQELRRKELAEKQHKEDERMQKRREILKQQTEDKKRHREEHMKRVAQLREMQMEKAEAQKKQIVSKMMEKQQIPDRIREEKQREGTAKQKVRLRKQQDAEERRKQEDEDRLRKQQEQEEEDRRYEDMQQRKREYEEQERLKRSVEDKRRQDEVLAEAERKRQEELQRLREMEEEKKRAAEDRELERQREITRIQAERAKKERRDMERLKEREKELQENLVKMRENEKKRLEAEQAVREKQKHDESTISKIISCHNAGVSSYATQLAQKQATLTSTNTSNTLNTTLTVTTTVIPGQAKSPQSYIMTPLRKPSADTMTDNYDISNLRSDDESDDEEEPRQAIPSWAQGAQLKAALINQYYQPPDIDHLFPCIPDLILADLFQKKKPRFYKRTSSALWDSPMLKPSATAVAH